MSSSWQEEDKHGEEVSRWQLSAQPVGDAIIMLPAHWPERDMWSRATGDQEVNHGGQTAPVISGDAWELEAGLQEHNQQKTPGPCSLRPVRRSGGSWVLLTHESS